MQHLRCQALRTQLGDSSPRSRGRSKGTTVYLNGSGFATGATVTAFTNGSGVTGQAITATVTKVTSGVLTLSVAVTAPDTNTASRFHGDEHPSGGVARFLPQRLQSCSVRVRQSRHPCYGHCWCDHKLHGRRYGLEAGAVVTLSPANGTCGTATVTSATSITVSCTLGTPSSVGTDLVVTNPDGGSATGTTPVLAPAAAPRPRQGWRGTRHLW